MIRNILFQLHWLLGISAGVVLAVVGVTGAGLSCDKELLAALNPGVVNVAPRVEPRLAPAQIVEQLGRQRPNQSITSMTWYAEPGRAVRVTFAVPVPATAARPVSGQGARRGEIRYVDPYNGRLLGGTTLRGQTLLRSIEQIHRNLATGPNGRLVVGVSTIALVVLCVTGLYLRWPPLPRDWRQWFHVNFALRGRVFLWRLHAVFGTAALLLYLSAGLSGLYMSFEWYRHAVNSAVGAKPPARAPALLEKPAEGDVDLDKVWLEFERTAGRYDTVNLILPQSREQAVEFRYLAPDAPHERAFGRLVMQPTTAQVISREAYAAQSVGNKFVSGIFPLHSGRLLGVTGTVLMMAASFAMPFFAITGWLMYLKRRRRAT